MLLRAIFLFDDAFSDISSTEQLKSISSNVNYIWVSQWHLKTYNL